MSQLTPIAGNEIRKFSRDSILLLVLFAPILILALVRLGIPLLAEVLSVNFAFQLGGYYPLIFIFFCTIFPMLFGMLIGFSMLDEQDEKVLQFIAVTPFSRRGYLWMKFAVPTLLLLPILVGFALLSGLFDGHLLRFLPLAVILAGETPLMGMFLVGFANNKVEGLALGKVSGIMFALPAAGYFIAPPWQYLLGVSPMFWVMKAYWAATPLPYWVSIGIGLLMHAGFFILLYRKFTRKVLQF